MRAPVTVRREDEPHNGPFTPVRRFRHRAARTYRYRVRDLFLFPRGATINANATFTAAAPRYGDAYDDISRNVTSQKNTRYRSTDENSRLWTKGFLRESTSRDIVVQRSRGKRVNAP